MRVYRFNDRANSFGKATLLEVRSIDRVHRILWKPTYLMTARREVAQPGRCAGRLCRRRAAPL